MSSNHARSTSFKVRSLSFSDCSCDNCPSSKFDYCEIVQNEMPVMGSSDKVKLIYTRLGKLVTISVYSMSGNEVLMEGDDGECVIPLANCEFHNIANALQGRQSVHGVSPVTTHVVTVLTKDGLAESRPAVVGISRISVCAFAGERVPNFSVSFNHFEE